VASDSEVSSSSSVVPGGAPGSPSPRAGSRALSVLATPLNFLILRALSERPMRLADLRKAAGLPAQTTLRGHLAGLGEEGLVAKRATPQMPYAVENELTPMGEELLDVAERLESWLQKSPDGPISLESGAAKGAVKALVDGWGSAMIGALAVRPLSLTELDSLISGLSYPALERRLSSMRIAGLVEAAPSHGSGTPYAVTDWGRRGVAPLAAASRCERIHRGEESPPVTQRDIEAAFLLATPLAGLPTGATGLCQLEVEAGTGGIDGPAGVRVTIEDGAVVGCVSRLEPAPGAYAIGSAATWFSAVSAGETRQLRFGGSRRLAEDLVGGMHAAFTPR
jgi:DNA-binding HxlR family transcriptional regulator